MFYTSVHVTMTCDYDEAIQVTINGYLNTPQVTTTQNLSRLLLITLTAQYHLKMDIKQTHSMAVIMHQEHQTIEKPFQNLEFVKQKIREELSANSSTEI